jgi:hypothetical protein
LGPAGTGVTTIPADTGSLAGAREEAAAHRAHLQAQRGRARAESTVGFELLEHTNGVGIRAHAASLEEAFGAWRPGQGDQVGLVLDADDLGSLLVDWLNEVVHLHEARRAPALGHCTVLA